MPVFGRKVDVVGGRRREVREQVLLAASAITLENSQSVIVEDVCRKGAKLRGRNLPPIGTELLVKVGSVEVLAAIAWGNGDERGISFDLPLDAGGVTLLKREGRWANLMGLEPIPCLERGSTKQPSYRLTY